MFFNQKQSGKKVIMNGNGREAGVASVVALMLLLAVIVTFLSLYATTYLPALKQQAEIEQTTSVKEAFMRFDNDMDHVLSEKKDASYGETIRLGGGDILLNPEKSSGMLAIGDPEILCSITISNSTGTLGLVTGSIVNVSYVPSYSYWENQGYSWQYGYINTTKGKRETPLSYYTMEDAREKRIGGYAQKFLEITAKSNATNPDYPGELDITAVTIGPSEVAGEKGETSGNGMGVLRINSTVTKSTFANAGSDLTVSARAVDATNPFYSSLETGIQQQMSAIKSTYSSLGGADAGTLTIPGDAGRPVIIVLTVVRISVYVQ
jgi:hypothetical protein